VRKKKRPCDKGGRGFGEPSRQTSNGVFVSQDVLSFSNIEEIPGLLRQIGVSASDTYKDLLQETRKIIQSSEPLQLLATLASHGLTVGIAKDGRQSRLIGDERFSQQHVELVQALCLTIGADEFIGGLVNPADIQRLFELLPELGQAYGLHRLSALDDSSSDEEKSIRLLQQYLRLHTQSVRNWGFMNDVIDIISDLLRPLNSKFQVSLGISGTGLVEMFRQLVRDCEAGLDLWRNDLVRIFAEKSIDGMIKSYLASAQDHEEQVRSVTQFIRHHNLSRLQVKTLILEHRSLLLVKLYSFSAEELALSLGLHPDDIEKVLNNLSLSFGDFSSLYNEGKISYFFLDNPVWTKPLIKIVKGSYYCPTPQVFFSFVFPIIGELCSTSNILKTAYEGRRADFLEDRLADVFQQALPGSKVFSGYKWREGNTDYENDLMIQFNSTIILVEAKSGSISWPALRGAPDRAKKHIRDLIYEPSRQSERLAGHLQKSIKCLDLDTSPLDNLPVDTTNICSILRLSVTLEDFATLQSNLRLVKQTGWIPVEHVLAPCITLSDLQVVVDKLGTPGRILHYLRLRTQIEEQFNYTGDELDILGLFLTSNINSLISASAEAHLMILGMSKEIDDYFIGLDAGASPKKPELKQTEWFRDIEQKVELSTIPMREEVTDILLGCTFGEQERLQKMFRWVVKNVRRNRRDPLHKCSVILEPYGLRRNCVVFYAFHSSDAQHRHARIGELADQVFDNFRCMYCVVVGMAIDRSDYPYSTLALVLNPDLDPKHNQE
jgi:hypothetical protein